ILRLEGSRSQDPDESQDASADQPTNQSFHALGRWWYPAQVIRADTNAKLVSNCQSSERRDNGAARRTDKPAREGEGSGRTEFIPRRPAGESRRLVDPY